jgi:hypothetical protein
MQIKLGYKAWVFMATTRRVLANEDIPVEAETFKQTKYTSGEQ